MKYIVYGLVSVLAILVAIVSLAYAGVIGSSENMTSNLSNNTSNITLNQTTVQVQIVVGGARDGINDTIALNASEIITSNATRNASREGKVLRAGGKSAKASKALGGNSSRQTAGTEIGLEPKAEFNLSQRQGNVSVFAANSDIYTPLFSQNQYTRTKPAYLAPENLSTREVYNIAGYPVIMLPNSIP